MSEWPEQFVLDFIAEYRKYECLWKYKHRSYKETAIAFENLRKFCEKSNKPATIKCIQNTFKELTKSYKEELIKFMKSVLDNRDNDEDFYSPNLYYFNAMNFLLEQTEIPNLMKNKINEESNSVQEDEDLTSDDDYDSMNESMQDQEDDIKEEPNEEDEDQTCDDDDDDSTDESTQDLSDTEHLTPGRKQSKKNTDDLLGVRETGEFDSIDNNEDRIIDDHDYVNEPIQDLPRAAPITPGSNQWVDVNTAYRISSDVASSSRIPSNTQKKVDRNTENTNDLDSTLMQELGEFDSILNDVAAKYHSIEAGNRLMQKTDEFDSNSNKKNRKIDDRVFMNKSNQSLPVIVAPTTRTSEQWLSTKPAHWTSPDTQKNQKKIANGQSFDVAASSTQKNQKKIDQKEGNTDRIRVVALRTLMQRTDEFDNISNNRNQTIDDRAFTNKSNQSLPVIVSPTTCTSEQWLGGKTARWISPGNQENHREIASGQSLDVATSNGILSSTQKNHKKIDQKEGNTNDRIRVVALKKLMQRTDEFDNISNNRNQIIDNHEYDMNKSIQSLSVAAPTTSASGQCVGVKTTHRVSSDTQENARNEFRQETNKFAKPTKNVAATSHKIQAWNKLLEKSDESDNISRNSNRTFNVRDDLIVSDSASSTPTSDQSVDFAATSEISPGIQNTCKEIVKKQTVDIATASKISFQQKHKKIANGQSANVPTTSTMSNTWWKKNDQNKENTDNLLGVREADEFGTTGNNEDQIMADREFMDESIQDLPHTTLTTPTYKQRVDNETVHRISSGTCRKRKNIASEQSFDVATTSNNSPKTQKKLKKRDHNEKNKNVACSKLMQELGGFDNIVNDDEQIIHDPDESVENFSEAAFPTDCSFATSDICNKFGKKLGVMYKKIRKQLIDVTTATFYTQNKQKKVGKNLENHLDDPVTETNEINSIDNIEDQLIDDRVFMDESNQDLSDAAPPSPASTQSGDFAIANMISPNAQRKRKNIASELASGVSPKKLKKINHVIVACSKLIQELDEYDSIGNNQNQIIHNHAESTEDLSDLTSSILAYKQLGNVATPSCMSSGTQKNWISSNPQSNYNKTDQKERITNNFGKGACGKSIRQTDEFDGIGNDDDESIEDYSDATSTTSSSEQSDDRTTSRLSSSTQRDLKEIASEQLADVATTSRISSNPQRNHKKTDQDKGNTNKLGKGARNESIRQTDEFDGIGNDDDQINEESIEDYSDTTSTTSSSEQSDDRTTSRLSSSTQRDRKEIASEQLEDVATTSGISSNPQRNHKKSDQDKGNINKLGKGARNESMRQTGRFDSIGNDDDQINDESIEDYSDTTSTTSSSEQSDDRTTSRLSSSTQRDRKEIASEQLENVATTSGMSSNPQRNHKKTDQDKENTNKLGKGARNESIPQTDEFNGIGNDDDQINDESIEDYSDAGSTTSSSEQSDDRTTSRLSSSTQRDHRKIACEQLADVATTSIVSSNPQRNHRKTDQNEGKTNKFGKGPRNKLIHHKFVNIGNDDDQINDESVEDNSDTASTTSASEQSDDRTTSGLSSSTQRDRKEIFSEQLADVATTSRLSSNPQRNHRKTDQNEERTNKFGKGPRNKSIRRRKFDNIGNDDDQINGVSSVEDNSDSASTTNASEQSDDRTTSRLSSSTQRDRKEFVSEQLADVATTSRTSSNSQRNHRKTDQDKGNTNKFGKGPRNKSIRHHKFNNIGNDGDQINDESIEDNSDGACTTPASEQSDDKTTSRLSSTTQRNRKEIASEQLADVATTSRTSFNSPYRKKIDHNKENSNDLVKVVCGKLMKETDEHDSFGNHVAAKLRGIIDTSQRIIAEKLISDVLYHAQMNSLNPAAVLANIPLASAPNP